MKKRMRREEERGESGEKCEVDGDVLRKKRGAESSKYSQIRCTAPHKLNR